MKIYGRVYTDEEYEAAWSVGFDAARDVVRNMFTLEGGALTQDEIIDDLQDWLFP